MSAAPRALKTQEETLMADPSNQYAYSAETLKSLIPHLMLAACVQCGDPELIQAAWGLLDPGLKLDQVQERAHELEERARHLQEHTIATLANQLSSEEVTPEDLRICASNVAFCLWRPCKPNRVPQPAAEPLPFFIEAIDVGPSMTMTLVIKPVGVPSRERYVGELDRLGDAMRSHSFRIEIED